MTMLSKVLVEITRVREDLLGVVYDFLKKFNDDKTGNFLRKFKMFLRDELVMNPRLWKTLTRVRLGTGLKTPDNFFKAFEKAKIYLEGWAGDIIIRPNFTVSPEEKFVELILVTNYKLGLTRGGTREETYKCAFERGLEKCPAEVGPQFAIQFGIELKEYERVLIGMEPINNCEGSPIIFSVSREEFTKKLHLGDESGCPGSFFNAGCVWVFVRSNIS